MSNSLPIESFAGFKTNNFYCKRKERCPNSADVQDMRLKRKLRDNEKYVASKKAADAVSLNRHKHESAYKNIVGGIITSPSKEHIVFSKQDDAINFSQNKVILVMLFLY